MLFDVGLDWNLIINSKVCYLEYFMYVLFYISIGGRSLLNPKWRSVGDIFNFYGHFCNKSDM